MLTIRNLHVNTHGKEILKGIFLQINRGEIHVLMGPNGAGKSTLSAVLAGDPKYKVTEGEIIFNKQNLLKLSPEQRSFAGLFLSFQYPIELPGVSIINFMHTAVNEHRKYKGEKPISSSKFIKMVREKQNIIQLDENLLNRSVNEGFSGGEKKKNEIFQMAILNPQLSILDETDSGLDIDALRIVSNGINSLKSPQNSIIIITHYQRLLNFIHPDKVHVLYNGQIVKTGTSTLVLDLEKKGYDWIKK